MEELVLFVLGARPRYRSVKDDNVLMLKQSLLILVMASILGLGGCASLPAHSEIVLLSKTVSASPRMIGPEGPLSPMESEAAIELLEKGNPRSSVIRHHLALMSSLGVSPPTTGNRLTLYADGRAAYAAIFSSILAAVDHVNIESFSIHDDKIGAELMAALLNKREEGVDVNMIYDSLGCFEMPGSFFTRLRDAGVRTVEFSPVNPLKAGWRWDLNHRDHRKLLILDGMTAYTGSVNYGRIYARQRKKHWPVNPLEVWEDMHLRVDGPAVAEFQKSFIDEWTRGDGAKLPRRRYLPWLRGEGNEAVQVLANKPGDKNRVTYMAYISAITHASSYVYLHTPYFVPDDQMRRALCSAAGRGVDVRILVPWKNDWEVSLAAGKVHYEELLRAGVKLYRARGPMPHGKYAIVDGVWSTIGSSNLNMRSFLADDEVDTVIFGLEFALKMLDVYQEEIEEAKCLTLDEWRERPAGGRIREWFSHLIERWL